MDRCSPPDTAHDDVDAQDYVCAVPSLQSLCVKVVGAHLNSIDSLGDMPYEMVKPILEDKRCTPDILRKLETNSPHLKEYDQEIWQKFYFERYPEKADQYTKGDFPPVKSWRKLFTQSIVDDEEKLKGAASRLREAKKASEKKERQLQITDKVPPAKRARWGDSSWGFGPSKPKTLLEKARTQSKKASTVYRGPSSFAPSAASSYSSTSSSRLPTSTPSPKVSTPSTSSSTLSRTQAHGRLLQAHLSTSTPTPPKAAVRSGIQSLSLASSSPSPVKHVSRTFASSSTKHGGGGFSSTVPDLVFSQGPPGLSRRR